MNLNALLMDIVNRYPGLSDIHFKVGRAPLVRVTGQLNETSYGKIGDDLTKGMAKLVLNPRLSEHFHKGNSVDTSYVIPDFCRFRVNVFWQRGTVALVMRFIPPKVQSIDELSMPPILKEISLYERGLVLVTG